MPKFFYATSPHVTEDAFDQPPGEPMRLKEPLGFEVVETHKFETFSDFSGVIVTTTKYRPTIAAWQQNDDGRISDDHYETFIVGQLYPALWVKPKDGETYVYGTYVVVPHGRAYQVVDTWRLEGLKLLPPQSVNLQPFPVWEQDATHAGQVLV